MKAIPVSSLVKDPLHGFAADTPRDARSLSAAILRGDANAFETFYRMWFDRSVALVARLTRRDESFCLDVVQSAMLRAAKRMPLLKTDAELARWLARVLHRGAIDALRREARRARRERNVGLHVASSADDAPAQKEHLAWLRRELALLDDADRALLILRFGSDCTFREAGEATGHSPDASNGRVRRALQRLNARAMEDSHHEH